MIQTHRLTERKVGSAQRLRKNCVDAFHVTRCGDLSVFKGKMFVAKRCSEYFLCQRQDLKKPQKLFREAPFAVLPARSRSRTMVADYPEHRCANVAFDRIGFGEGQGACRWIRVLPLEEDI